MCIRRGVHSILALGAILCLACCSSDEAAEAPRCPDADEFASDEHVVVVDGGMRVCLLPVGLEDDLAPEQDSQDTVHLRSALESLAPGGVLEILPGTVHVSNTVMAYDFVGEIVGAGHLPPGETTTIVARGPWDEDLGAYVFPGSPFHMGSDRTEAFVFWFLPSDARNPVDLRMADLHITAEGGSVRTSGPPAWFPTRALGGAVLVTGVVTEEQPNWPAPYEVPSVDITLARVFVEGQDDVVDSRTWEVMSNFLDGLLVQGGGDRLAPGQSTRTYGGLVPIAGRVTVQESRFDNLLRSGVWIVGLVSPGFNVAAGEERDWLTVCHRDDGSRPTEEIITVDSMSEVQAHLDHGDPDAARADDPCVDPWTYPLDRGRSSATLVDSEFNRVGYWGHWVGLMFFDCYDADLEIRDNVLEESGGYSLLYHGGYSRGALGAFWHPLPRPGEEAVLTIADNQVGIVTGFGHAFPDLGGINWPAIKVHDFAPSLPDSDLVAASITGNRVTISGLGLECAAIHTYAVNDLRVEDNRVESGSSGVTAESGLDIDSGGDTASAGHWISNNDMSGLEVSSGYHYRLGAQTSSTFLCDPHDGVQVEYPLDADNVVQLGPGACDGD